MSGWEILPVAARVLIAVHVCADMRDLTIRNLMIRAI
jgi:hypothetical protein